MTDMLSSGLWYAERGLHVFPLTPGSKVPHKGTAGCKDATTDPDLIVDWWNRWPGSNLGIATGYVVDVVDIDGIPGQASRTRLWCKQPGCENPDCTHPGTFNRIEADQLGKVLTPRPGGMHLYVPATGDGNASNIYPGVDYRGIGGFVVAPPSVLGVRAGQTAGTYRWLGRPKLAELAP